jgi:hypothetical protein
MMCSPAAGTEGSCRISGKTAAVGHGGRLGLSASGGGAGQGGEARCRRRRLGLGCGTRGCSFIVCGGRGLASHGCQWRRRRCPDRESLGLWPMGYGGRPSGRSGLGRATGSAQSGRIVFLFFLNLFSMRKQIPESLEIV